MRCPRAAGADCKRSHVPIFILVRESQEFPEWNVPTAFRGALQSVATMGLVNNIIRML